MKKTQGCLVLVVGLILVGVLFTTIKYYGSYFWDLYQRPWAYSRDANAPLLVGKWQGRFIDPDGVAKKLALEIFVPTTDEERWEKAGRKSRRRRGSSARRNFEGVAWVESKLGNESYELWGGVNKDDYHLFTLDFITDETKMVPINNFYINDSNPNNWRDDSMTLTLSFSYRRPDKSSFWSSSDPRFDKKVTVTLIRQKQ